MKPIEYLARDAYFDVDVAETAHQALARYPELHEHLALNINLSVKTWLLLFNSSPNAAITKSLVGRPLTHELRAVVIAKEKRDTILAEFVSHNPLTAEELAQFEPSRIKGRLAKVLINSDWVSKSTKLNLCNKVDLIERIRLVCDPSFIDEPIPVGLFDKKILAKPINAKAKRSSAYSLLLYQHPELVSNLLSTGNDAAITAIAGSPAVSQENIDLIIDVISKIKVENRKYAFLALIANPRIGVDRLNTIVGDKRFNVEEHAEARLAISRRKVKSAITTSYKEVNGDELRCILTRSLPNEYRPSGRPAEMLNILGNAALGSDELVLVRSLSELQNDYIWGAVIAERWPEIIDVDPELKIAQLSDSENSNFEIDCDDKLRINIEMLNSLSWQLQSRHLASFSESLAQKLGNNSAAWETFLTLFNSFNGPISELLEVSRSI